MTHIHGINIEPVSYRVVVDNQFVGRITFSEILDTRIEGLLKKNEDLKSEVVVLCGVLPCVTSTILTYNMTRM